VIAARVDPALGVRVIGERELRYARPEDHDEDRPAHVRAASGLAFSGGRLVVIQDDVSFVATVVGDEVDAIALPRGPGGRRRFEDALGNRLDKLDLEACVVVGGDVWAFGSGSLPVRERIAIVGYETRLHDAGPLYRKIRDVLDGPINLEGAARPGDELWLFHRGNTGPDDEGPAIVRFELAALRSWLDGLGAVPAVRGWQRYDLGRVEGVRLGFTDAAAAHGRVMYLAAAEDAPDAIEDGRVVGAQLGVIEEGEARAAPLSLGKVEGLAIDPDDPRHAWLSVDPDDPDAPARLYEVELVGPWWP
jgi:hypothetical protein